MTDEELVATLAEAMSAVVRLPPHAFAVLLPVVRRVAEQRAAEELLAMGDDWDSCCKFGVIARRHLRDRAAALTATPNHGRSAT